MKNTFFVFFYSLLALLSVACNKVDPNPELRDAIYLDLQAQSAATSRDLAEAEKTLEEHKKSLLEVTPQTGQIKYAQKRVFEAESVVVKLKQQDTYFKIRIEERLKFTRKKYLESIRNNSIWPDQREVDEYLSEKRLRQAKMQWDYRERIEQSKKDNKINPKNEGGGE